MNIAERIYDMLSNNEDITAKVDTRIYHQTTDLVE